MDSIPEPLLTDRISQPADYKLETSFAPNGDQPRAITELTEGIANQERDQVLLGVTGSGKTFTIAHVIAKTKRPALILAPNSSVCPR